jgi:hypothetical protein
MFGSSPPTPVASSSKPTVMVGLLYSLGPLPFGDQYTTIRVFLMDKDGLPDLMARERSKHGSLQAGKPSTAGQ